MKIELNDLPNISIFTADEVARCAHIASEGVDMDLDDDDTRTLIHRIMLAIALGAKHHHASDTLPLNENQLTAICIYPATQLPECTAEDVSCLKGKNLTPS